MMFSKSGPVPDGKKAKKSDGIHWRMPTAMCSCWLLGIGLAIGHHFYYASLDGTLVGSQSQQEWSSRIGTGLAFLTKTFLTTAVGIACVQNLWWILRLKAVRLSTLDSMWDIRGSIFNFFDPHIWLRGPNVAILGLISWCIPLVTVVTPSTLSVQSTTGSIMSQQQMSGIDYEFTKFYTMDDGGPTGPSPSISRFVTGAIVQGNVINIPAPAPNSSYTLSFTGPLIQCSNSSANISQQIREWSRNNYAQYVAFMGFSPGNDNISYALDRLAGYDSAIANGYGSGDTNADIVDKLVMTIWPFMDDSWVIECGMYNASYTVNFNFTNGAQSTEITDFEVLGRVRTYNQHILPKPANEDQLFAYTGMMEAFKDVLEGRCWANPSRCTGSQIYSTGLINSKQVWNLVFGTEKVDNITYDSLGTILDVASELGKNLTLSYFGNTYFLNSTQGSMVDVYHYPNQTEYVYASRNLFIAYGVAVFVSLLCIIAGILTMWDNGITFTDSFSTILRATRNKKFDEIVPDDSTTGADPPPESLSNTRVQWMPASGRDDAVAGLKPLQTMAEPEKAESRSPVSPITFSNRIRERKSYRPTVSRVDTSPEGFI
ncbi:hypothetical protein BJX99DRAFT_93954 [Aspergillus californicus]